MATLPSSKPGTWLNPTSILVSMEVVSGACMYRAEEPSGG